MNPGTPEFLRPAADLRITNVALGAELADQSARTSLKFTYNKPIRMDDSEDEDEEPPTDESTASTVLCSLTPGKVCAQLSVCVGPGLNCGVVD